VHDIRDGKLEILYISRVAEVCLGVHHRECRDRQWDSLAITLSGSCNYCMSDGTVIRKKAGDILYLPLHCAYTMDILTNDYSYIVCDFRVAADEERRWFAFSSENPQSYEKLFHKLRLTYSDVQPESRAASMALLFQIYAQLVRDCNPSYVGGETRRKIESARAYIQANASQPWLSVGNLVKEFQLSETHLRRLFRAMYGVTPSRYIMNARIEHAKSLMGLPELTLQDIASQSGFSSFTYFCTAFKTATGYNPTYYRQHFHGRR